MTTYNYEIVPVTSKDRDEHRALTVTGTVVAVSYGSATQMASAKAAEISKEQGREYGVARVW